MFVCLLCYVYVLIEVMLFYVMLCSVEIMTRQDIVSVSSTMNNMTSNSAILSHKPPPVPGKYMLNLPMCERHLLQDLDINGVSWVDSMRASSPTHLKSIPSSITSSDSLAMVSQFLNDIRGRLVEGVTFCLRYFLSDLLSNIIVFRL